ncbi:hypothetical protein FCV25MIE_14952, partial [Fagus crenata]
MEDKIMVLKQPKKESAMKAPNNGKIKDAPNQVLTFFAAIGMGSWSSSMIKMATLHPPLECFNSFEVLLVSTRPLPSMTGG